MASISLKEFWSLTEEERGERYRDLTDHDKFLVRISMDPGVVDSQCNFCRHYHGFGKCDAYPDGIPRPLLFDIRHDQDYPGDHGTHFEPKEE